MCNSAAARSAPITRGRQCAVLATSDHGLVRFSDYLDSEFAGWQVDSVRVVIT